MCRKGRSRGKGGSSALSWPVSTIWYRQHTVTVTQTLHLMAKCSTGYSPRLLWPCCAQVECNISPTAMLQQQQAFTQTFKTEKKIQKRKPTKIDTTHTASSTHHITRQMGFYPTTLPPPLPKRRGDDVVGACNGDYFRRQFQGKHFPHYISARPPIVNQTLQPLAHEFLLDRFQRETEKYIQERQFQMR